MTKQSTDELWEEVERLQEEKANNNYRIQLNAEKKAELSLQQKEVAQKQAELIHETVLKAGLDVFAKTDKIGDEVKGLKTQVKAMNSNLVGLNDSLKNSTQLEALYEAKRQQLDIDFTSQKNTLNEALNTLKKDIDLKRSELKAIDDQIGSKRNELSRVKLRYAFQNMVAGKFFFPAFLTFWSVFLVLFLMDGFPAFFSWIQSLMN